MDQRDRVTYNRQLRLLVSVFSLCAVLSLTGCLGRKPMSFFPGGGGLPIGNGDGNSAPSNHGRGSSGDSHTQLPDDADLTILSLLLNNNPNALFGIAGGIFSPQSLAGEAHRAMVAPFGIRSLAILNTIPRTNLVNAAVGGLVDVVSNSFGNKSYVEYVARFGGGTTATNTGNNDVEWASARLYWIPPGFENSETFVNFSEPGLWVVIVTHTHRHGIVARGKELIAAYGDLVNSSASPKVFLEFMVYDMEALAYVNGKLAASGHQCDRNLRGEFGIGGTNGAIVHTIDSVAFDRGPQVVQDYFIRPGFLRDDWQTLEGAFATLANGIAESAPPLANDGSNRRSTSVIERLEMAYYNVSADVNVNNANRYPKVAAGVVAKSSSQGRYIGRIINKTTPEGWDVYAQIIKQVSNGTRHLLKETLISRNSSFGLTGKVRFKVEYESGHQRLRLYYKPTGTPFENIVAETHHDGITHWGSAGIEGVNGGRLANFIVNVGEDDRQIENLP